MATVPYSRQDIDDDDVAAVVAVLRSDHLTQGPVVPDFEAAFARRHQVAHAVAVSNATAALHLACIALGAGPGTRVWTTPNSFVASANCALYCGAEVDFVDIDPTTRNMSHERLCVKLADADARGALPHVVVPVDFAGLPCDLEAMRTLADRYGFRILEDASHAAGASDRGHPVGSRHADATVFSFHAVKVMTTAEGGMVTTRDAGLAERLRALRSHGITRDPHRWMSVGHGAWYYEQQTLGFNCRMTELQAALGRSQLARLDAMQARRRALADRYDALLAGLPLRLPARPAGMDSAWHLYVVEIDEERTSVGRDAVFESMRAAGIGVNVHYIPIHLQPWYRRLGFEQGDFPAAEAYARRTLTLPLFPRLTEAEQDAVIAALRRALAVPAAGNAGVPAAQRTAACVAAGA